MSPVLFNSVNAEIALVVAGGVGPTDSRVMAETNAAQRVLMQMVPRGIFVGAVTQATVAVTGINVITLPPGMDVALVVEGVNFGDPIINGWYNILDPATLVDPDEIMDTAMVDLGFVGGNRTYLLPELPTGTTQVNVWGLNAFVPIVNPTDPLLVPNVEAIKLMIQGLAKANRFEDLPAAKEYKTEAVALLTSELQRNLQDPQRYAARLAQWRLDEQNYADGTLGYARAKIALDVANGQKTGRYKINRLVYRAISWVYQRYYEYQLVSRNRIKTSVPTLYATPSSASAAINPPIQFEIIRQLVQSMLAEDNQGLDEDRGTGRLTPGAELVISQKLGAEVGAQLTLAWDAELEQLRHTTYASTLQALIAAGQFSYLGYVTGKFGLETQDGLKFSDVELDRIANEASRQACLIYNALGKQDRYSNAAGPNTLTFAYAQNSSSPLTYYDYEVLNYLMQAQLPGTKPEDIMALKREATILIERNLAQSVDAQRSTARYARLSSLSSQFTSIGYISARLGLEMVDPLAISDLKLYRLINEAAREALQQRNFLSRTERYSNLAGPEVQPFLPAVADTDPVAYPDLEVLRRLVGAQTAEGDGAASARAEAVSLIERNLQKAIEASRNSKWQCLLEESPAPQFGGVRAACGLEIAGDSGQDGYKFSDQYIGRMTQQAWAQLVDQFNSDTRLEDYEENALLPPSPFPNDSDVVPFPFELVKLTVEALVCQDKNEEQRATGYKQQAAELLQRNVIAGIERGRRVTCEQQVTLTQCSFGYTVGRLGLELMGGLGMADAYRRRLVNEAEQLLADSGRWKFFEGEYFLAVNPVGQVVVPSDVESIIFAEWHRRRVELRDRKWLYMGWAVRRGGDEWEGWAGHGGRMTLDYAGPDENGNANYILDGGRVCAPEGVIPYLRALCRRKWVLKVNDTDSMLVQSYPAIKRMVQSLLAGAAGDAQNASMHYNGALKALDNQLGVETEGQVNQPTVLMPGLRHHMHRERRRY
jgi:hypothetical protein